MRRTALLSIVALLATMLPSIPALAQVAGPTISEIRIDQTGTDNDEYFELTGVPQGTLDSLTYLVIGDGTGGSGVIEAVVDLTGATLDANGFFVAAESTFSLGTANLTADLNFENSDNVTHLLVEGFSGADGDDLDANDDGTLDVTPWTGELDRVALVEEDNPPTGTEFHYGPPQVGPDGDFVPGHVFICDDWEIGAFDPAAGQDTPGAPNDCDDPSGDPSECVFINEFHYDNTGTDADEAVEVVGTPGSLDGFSLVLYNGSGGAVYATLPLTGNLVDQVGGYGTAVFDHAGIQNGSPDGIALVDPNGDVLQFLSYEGAFIAVGGPADGRLSVDIGVFEDGSTPVGQSLQLTGNGNANFTWTGPVASSFGAVNDGQTFSGDCPTPEPPPPLEYTDLTIPEIQGPGHFSPHDGERVRTTGVVTAVETGNGYYLQDPNGDDDDDTSDAIYVFDDGAGGVAVGDAVTVEGVVEEFVPGGTGTRNLPTTEIVAHQSIVGSSGNPIPSAVEIGRGGRLPPTEVIEDDNFGSFDIETDGLDFFEAIEAMLVEVDRPTTVAGTTQFGEIFTIPRGVFPTQRSFRGTLNISPDDYNPERVQIDPNEDVFDIAAPTVDTGARLSDVTGVVGYSFGNFEVIPTEPFDVVRDSRLRPERTLIGILGFRLTVASYNILNLDPNEGDGDTDIADGRFAAVASDIVHNLRSPDIVGLQEVQDNSGSTDDGVTSATATLQLLVDEIEAAGGPSYEFIDNTFIGNNTSGGQPGANIRVAYLYNPERVDTVGVPDTVVDPADQQSNPDNPFFETRLPLVQTFEFRDRNFTVVNNHFASKSGSAPLYGTEQNSTERQEDPVVNGSLDQRRAQAQAVNDYLAPAFDADENLVVLGDFNEFEFISPLLTLGENLENLTLEKFPNERYSYIFEGNSQSLDHILVSDHLKRRAHFDAVHINAEFAATASSSSDHDPLITSISVLGLPEKERPAYTLSVLHNNDGESDLLPDDNGAGSISRFGDLLIEQRSSLERGFRSGVVSLTAGDNFLASPEFTASLEKGPPYYDSIALEYIPYDLYTIGNHEFDFGPDVLANFISGIEDCEENPFLSANLIFDDEPALAALVDQGCIRSSTVVDRDGREIGIIGLTTPELREVSSPGNVQILTNLAEIANAEAQAMTADGIEIILLASHLQDLDNEVTLAADLSNIDAIIGGGGGEELAHARTATTADGTTIPIVTVPGDYFDVGRLELDFDRDGSLLEFDWDLLDVTGDQDQDAFLLQEVEQPVADFVADLDATIVATSEFGLNGVRDDVRSRETNVGNLLSDSFVQTVQAIGLVDGPIVGLQNGGGIRNDSIIPAGGITLLDTFDIAPFTNFVAFIEDVAPADLVAALEHGLSILPDPAGSFGQWSGLVVEYNAANAAGSRVVNLTVNGVEYVVNGTLQTGPEVVDVDLATIDFLAAGGDGYDVFEAYEFTRVVGVSYQQALADILPTADLTAGSTEYQPREDPALRTRIIPVP